MTQNTSFLKRQREPHFPTIAPQIKHFTIVNTWLAIIACLATMQRKVSTWRITSKCGGIRFCSLHSIFACCTPGHAGMCWGFPLCYQLGMRMEGQTSRHHQLGKQRHWVGSGTRASTLGQSSPRPMRKLEKKVQWKTELIKKCRDIARGYFCENESPMVAVCVSVWVEKHMSGIAKSFMGYSLYGGQTINLWRWEVWSRFALGQVWIGQ